MLNQGDDHTYFWGRRERFWVGYLMSIVSLKELAALSIILTNVGKNVSRQLIYIQLEALHNF